MADREQRQAVRAKVGWQLKIIFHGSTYPATCKDISAIGLGAYGLPVLPIGAKVQVVIETTNDTIEAAAIVVRQDGDLSAPEVDGVRRVTGMRFERLRPQALAALQRALPF